MLMRFFIYPANTCLFKVSDRSTKTMSETCSKSTILVSSLLTLNIFHTFFYCFYWVWPCIWSLGINFGVIQKACHLQNDIFLTPLPYYVTLCDFILQPSSPLFQGNEKLSCRIKWAQRFLVSGITFFRVHSLLPISLSVTFLVNPRLFFQNGVLFE